MTKCCEKMLAESSFAIFSEFLQSPVAYTFRKEYL